MSGLQRWSRRWPASSCWTRSRVDQTTLWAELSISSRESSVSTKQPMEILWWISKSHHSIAFSASTANSAQCWMLFRRRTSFWGRSWEYWRGSCRTQLEFASRSYRRTTSWSWLWSAKIRTLARLWRRLRMGRQKGWMSWRKRTAFSSRKTQFC